MYCSSCGTLLAANETICHACGKPTPLYFSHSGPSLYGSTSASQGQPPVSPLPYETQKPSTLSSAQQYPFAPPTPVTLPQYPHFAEEEEDSVHPRYMSAPTLPPTPPPSSAYQRQPGMDAYPASSAGYPVAPQPVRRKSVWMVVGIVLLALLLVGGGVGALLIKNQGHGSGAVSTPTVSAAQKNATATAIALASVNPYPPNSGTLVLNDPLHDNSKGYKWDSTTNTGQNSCGFRGGMYHLTEAKSGGVACIPEAKGLSFSDVTFEATITVVQGDNGGIALRINQKDTTFYYFSIYTNGKYVFEVYLSGKYKVLLQGNSSFIHQGLNQPNTLAVVAVGSNFVLYANSHKLDSASDSTYGSGQIGMITFYDNGLSDVVASNARAWKM